MKTERSKERLTILLLGLALVSSVFLTGGAVWRCVAAMLRAFLGVFVLLAYKLSGHSNPSDYRDFVPLDIYDSKFEGADTLLVMEAGLSGRPAPMTWDGGYKDLIAKASWSSLWVWILLIVVIFAMCKLYQKRKKQDMNAISPVCLMLSLVAAAPVLCALMLRVFGVIHTAGVFIVAEIAALLVFLVAWSKEPSGITQEE